MTLKQRGIRAEYLGSAQTDTSVQTKAENGQFDILYMTPEKACLIPTRYYLLSMNQLIVDYFDNQFLLLKSKKITTEILAEEYLSLVWFSQECDSSLGFKW